ncbi:hypothetical protein EDD21DRAFT_430630, partial [Dissophora ornata]
VYPCCTTPHSIHRARFNIPSSPEVPASVLLIQILQAQNQQAGSMARGITLIPTLSVGIDVMGIGVVLVSIMGLFGVAKGCRRLMNLYFGLVLCFIAFQVGNAIVGYMSGSSWVQEALEKSWDMAYRTDKGLIRDLQIELHCVGFHTQEDRAVPTSTSSEIYLPPCAEILQLRFGKRLQHLGSLILCIRLIQLTGVLLLSVLFKHLAAMDQVEESESEQMDEESSYFQNEKQIEDKIARMPLLSIEDDDDEDLPHYSVNDAYGSEDSCEGEGGDEGGQSRGSFCHDRFRGHAYEYRDLPEYAEDERETQVYVA